MIRLPCRLDLIGGWSDQECWPGPSAVINAAIGWDGGYPLTLDDTGRLHSEVVGVGTGLGISSILQAGRFLQANPHGDYVAAVLEWERAQGTRGGWQDQVGGITPGLKLIEMDGTRVRHWPTPPSFWPHLVLFDTGIRRPSRRIGDQVRSRIMVGEKTFTEALSRNVEVARALFTLDVDARTFSLECLAGWERLVACIPDIAVPLPTSPLLWGTKLCGAGGGGYGVAFVRDPETREGVCDWFRSQRMWAGLPELLDGVQFA